MKSKRLFNAIGNIDDWFIEEDGEGFSSDVARENVLEQQKIVKTAGKFAIPLAACLVLATILFAVGMPFSGNSFELAAFAAEINDDGTIEKQPLSLDLLEMAWASTKRYTLFESQLTQNKDSFIIGAVYRRILGIEISGNNIASVEAEASDGSFIVFNKGGFTTWLGRDYTIDSHAGETQLEIYWELVHDNVSADFRTEPPPLPEIVIIKVTTTFKDGSTEEKTIELTPD
jgi:hypothetical protein